jgi:hypothetical protein
MRWWEKSSLDQGRLNLDFVDEATALEALRIPKVEEQE